MRNNLLIIGKPGSGKGTQADLICEIFDIKQVSTGDIFRKNIKEQTELGKMAKEIIDAGNLVPDDITNDLVKSTIFEEEYKNGFLLDGYPRTLNQAQTLEKNLSDNNESISKVICIDVSDDVIVERMANRRVCLNCGSTYHLIFNKPQVEGICNKCGNELVTREDDKAEVVLGRLNTYNENTKPLIDYYNEKGLLVNIDGEKSPKEVGEAITNLFKDNK